MTSATPPTRDAVLHILSGIAAPGGGTLVSADLVRALEISGGQVRFVLEAHDAAMAEALAPARTSAIEALRAVPGITDVSVVLTAHRPAQQGRQPARAATPDAPPALKIGGHPTGAPQAADIPGVQRILAIGSGKGGVGKSTASANLAVALAREGRRVGLLDADIYGPSQPRMMGVNRRPASPDGKTIIPLQAHGVTMMSLGLMLKEDEAVIWRGPMLMGALQQMLTQVSWGALDVLLVDLPPGTGDVQLSLCQRAHVSGAIVVSTPQDVALLDARKALSMFRTLKVPVLGMIENMSTFHCPKCGHESQIFGHGGVAAEARALDLPLLGQVPIDLDTRLSGDAGTPIAATDSPAADVWRRIARGLIGGGMA